MNPVRFEGSQVIGAPKGWDHDKDGECAGLPAKITVTSSDLPMFTSIWKPTEEERARIARGENIALSCFSLQPPVMVSVADIDGPIVRFAHEVASDPD